jgi:SAM-dependent methyltransferase
MSGLRRRGSRVRRATRRRTQRQPLDRALLEGFVELADAGTVADLGRGPGHVTRFLAARHHNVIGVDLSPVRRARGTPLSPAARARVISSGTGTAAIIVIQNARKSPKSR